MWLRARVNNCASNCLRAGCADLSCRLDVAEQQRESSLKYQTRCVAGFSGAESFAVASVEGRVAMEILDPAPTAQEKKYAFKVTAAAGAQQGTAWHVVSAGAPDHVAIP